MSHPASGTGKDVRAAVLESLRYRSIGPHRGGRVVAVAGDVSNLATFYFGACAGGVWKTIDGGQYWHNVSDGFFNTAAVGAITVSTSDPNVIYVGTGETTIRGNVSHGDGVYKSTDGGRSWRNMGLAETRHIGKIVVHPDNPDLVYVAALGHAWGPNPERGVYRSKDGGETWEKVLYKSSCAGSHDVSIDPHNPRILFAAIWQAQRFPYKLENGGPDSGIWRSFDGGDTWQEITRNSGLPQGMLGKIGITVSPAQSGRVWAVVEAEDGAVFRSDDYGDSWTRLSEEPLLRTRPWYYMHITADPQDPDTVYVQNYGIWKSIDAGMTFHSMPTPHGDEHALWIDPNNNQRMIKGDDGGACVSYNGGQSWSSIYNQPTAQIYHVTTDNQVPYRIYGSQQDNSALSIPSQSVDGAIHERDWYAPGGGESGYIAVKPDDPNIVVASGPAGRRAYNDIMTLYDHRTGQKWNNTVWPELYGWGAGADSLKYRFQWTFPIHFSQHDPDRLYVCSQYVHRSTTLGSSWEVVSPDLTRNDPDTLKPSGGPITRDNTGAEVYATIFSLAESPHEVGVFWAGSDDGLIHLTRDDCRTWQNVTPPDDLLPAWSQILIIEPSPHDPATAYVAATRYKHDDPRPFVLKSSDYGQTWRDISGGLPEECITRAVREDPESAGLLYLATETGMYVSFDDGQSWQRMGGNLPVVPVHDMVVKDAELVVATHGRSFWVLDDLTPLRAIASGSSEIPTLFPPRTRKRIRSYGGMLRGEGTPGVVNYSRADTSLISIQPHRKPNGDIEHENLDSGENPPQASVITYYLPERATTSLKLEVRDDGGNVLRTFESVPGNAGINRIEWNWRIEGAPKVEGADLQPWDRPDGPMVLPGTYEAVLTVGDKTLRQSFVIEPDPRISTSEADLREQFDFLREILQSLSETNSTINQIGTLIGQLHAWSGRLTNNEADDLRAQVNRAIEDLRAIRNELIDVNMRGSQLWPSGLHEKLNALLDSVDSADYAPPRQAREAYATFADQLEGFTSRYRSIVRDQVSRINKSIESAGLPTIGLSDQR